MKKVGDYRKTLGVTKATELKEIKTIYRGLMKDWHPDKFSADAEKHAEAEEKSKETQDRRRLPLRLRPRHAARLPRFSGGRLPHPA